MRALVYCSGHADRPAGEFPTVHGYHTQRGIEHTR